MPIPVFDRVQETTTTSGTGSITLDGPLVGFSSFSSTVGVGNQTYYGIVDNSTGDWEVGTGTLSSSTTLARDTVLSSSNGGSLVSFTANTKLVFIDIPADKAVTTEMLNYVHTQSLASASWTINHNLGRSVSVTVVDTANNEIEGDVQYINQNTVVVSFSAAFSGSAYCN